MMKYTIIILMTLVSMTAFAKSEMVCEHDLTHLTTGDSTVERGDINRRILAIENTGRSVEITHISTDIGGTGFGTAYGISDKNYNMKYNGVLKSQRCVVLKY